MLCTHCIDGNLFKLALLAIGLFLYFAFGNINQAHALAGSDWQCDECDCWNEWWRMECSNCGKRRR